VGYRLQYVTGDSYRVCVAFTTLNRRKGGEEEAAGAAGT